MELLTASRVQAMQACPRRHYWRYEVGLRKAESADALRFGSAWHRAMEARWQGKTAEECWQAATGVDGELDPYQLAMLSAMLWTYFTAHAEEIVAEVYPEVEFSCSIPGSRTFSAAGKIDGLARLYDGRLAVIEHKTTSANIEPDSDYWLRLRADNQILTYVTAARAQGWNISTVIYDVAKKPGLQPKQVPLLDDAGLKIVLDNNDGTRAYLDNGKPRQAARDGETLQTRQETPEEYEARLLADIQSRYGYYFARREVPILDEDLEEFAESRIQVSRMILDRRRQQKPGMEYRAWPRSVSGMICPSCEYVSFCLQNTLPDLQHPPAGYEIKAPHEELETTVA